MTPSLQWRGAGYNISTQDCSGGQQQQPLVQLAAVCVSLCVHGSRSFVTAPDKIAQRSGGVHAYIQLLCPAESWTSPGSPSCRTDSLLLIMMMAYFLYTALAGLALLLALLYTKNPYFLQDLNYAITAIKIGMRLSKYKKSKPFYSMLDCFLDKVSRQPHKKFLLFEDSCYTYSQADKESNKVARALSTHANLQEGDTVALFLGNEPWFVWAWLALAKLGCTASLLNNNIRSKSLLHCFSCCDAKVLVAGAGEKELNECSFPALFFIYYLFIFLQL